VLLCFVEFFLLMFCVCTLFWVVFLLWWLVFFLLPWARCFFFCIWVRSFFSCYFCFGSFVWPICLSLSGLAFFACQIVALLSGCFKPAAGPPQTSLVRAAVALFGWGACFVAGYFLVLSVRGYFITYCGWLKSCCVFFFLSFGVGFGCLFVYFFFFFGFRVSSCPLAKKSRIPNEGPGILVSFSRAFRFFSIDCW